MIDETTSHHNEVDNEASSEESNEIVRVVAHLQAKPEAVKELKSVLHELTLATRAEKGCLKYELWQGISDETDFTFIEEWISDAALERHFASAHLKAAGEKLSVLLVAPSNIKKYRLVF